MIPRPPISTLFPYTTLFRSSLRRGRAPRGNHGERARHRRPRRRPRRVRARHRQGDRPRDGRHAPPDRDRKSTRLNSSHITISYAVFCLKKKRTTTELIEKEI